eukprot:scaffold4882_cov70-Phaeocystis_antarctica.AAC.17
MHARSPAGGRVRRRCRTSSVGAHSAGWPRVLLWRAPGRGMREYTASARTSAKARTKCLPTRTDARALLACG